MIQLVPQLRILLCVDAVDFRKGVDSLAAVCRERLDEDPFSGALFIFRNRAGTAIKILSYDGQGYWLCMKRWSKGRLAFWPTSDGERLHPMAAQELAVLLYNGNPRSAHFAPQWRRLA